MTTLSTNMAAALAQCATRLTPVTELHAATAASLMSQGAISYRRRGTRMYYYATKPGRALLEYHTKAHRSSYRANLKDASAAKRIRW